MSSARPNLSSWLPSQGRHILRPGDYPLPEELYDRFEELLASIKAIPPAGIADKRRRFKAADPNGLLALRTELLVGFRLAMHRIRYTCPQFPDFLCLGDFNGGIEVTSRNKDDMEMLDIRLADLPNPHGLRIQTAGGSPVLGEACIQRILDDARDGLRDGTGGTLEYADLELRVSIAKVIDPSIDISEWFAGIRKEIDACIAQLPEIISEKSHQAKRAGGQNVHPVVLFVDVSRFGTFGGSIGVFAWGGAHAEIAAQMEQLDLEAFDAVAVAISNLTTNSYNGVMRRRSAYRGQRRLNWILLSSCSLANPGTAAVPTLPNRSDVFWSAWPR